MVSWISKAAATSTPGLQSPGHWTKLGRGFSLTPSPGTSVPPHRDVVPWGFMGYSSAVVWGQDHEKERLTSLPHWQNWYFHFVNYVAGPAAVLRKLEFVSASPRSWNCTATFWEVKLSTDPGQGYTLGSGALYSPWPCTGEGLQESTERSATWTRWERVPVGTNLARREPPVHLVGTPEICVMWLGWKHRCNGEASGLLLAKFWVLVSLTSWWVWVPALETLLFSVSPET